MAGVKAFEPVGCNSRNAPAALASSKKSQFGFNLFATFWSFYLFLRTPDNEHAAAFFVGPESSDNDPQLHGADLNNVVDLQRSDLPWMNANTVHERSIQTIKVFNCQYAILKSDDRMLA